MSIALTGACAAPLKDEMVHLLDDYPPVIEILSPGDDAVTGDVVSIVGIIVDFLPSGEKGEIELAYYTTSRNQVRETLVLNSMGEFVTLLDITEYPRGVFTVNFHAEDKRGNVTEKSKSLFKEQD